MKEQILSRTRLQPIIDKFGLYAKDRDRVHMDDLVERLRTAVTIPPIEAMPGTQNRQLPGFYVNVTFDNPQIAQQICTEITSMFLEQNSREREQQASRTTSFLSRQVDEAKAKLDAQDAKLAQFKRQYLGSLPDEEQTNLSLLLGMNSQLEANTQALSRAQQDKVFNESMLGQQEANWKAAQSGKNPETSEQQLNALQDQLTALQARYTPEHPDVIKMQSQIEELKKRMAQIRILQGRVQASPMVEQQYKELTRNYQSALDFYNDLLKKREQSAMATDLEHQQESEQFRVFDPPSLPEKPSFPKKIYFAGGGLGAGLALGLGILFAIAVSDKAMYTGQDVELCLKVPVLALVPKLEIASAPGGMTGTVGSSYVAGKKI
jgi:uncharacterized protein involved in exopolysaccharide biosynthesis